jgi:hypothetical protein
MPDSGQDLINFFREQRVLLIDCVDAMKHTGRKLAESEYKYKIALRKEILRLHVEDKVAWTACYDMARGLEEVALLRMKRDIHKSDYECCVEKINAVKMEIRLLEKEIYGELRSVS